MKTDRKELLELIQTLSNHRKNQVFFTVKVEKLVEKKKLLELAMRRLEARHINDVDGAKDQDNRPLLTSEWSKRAAVEQRLADDPQFTKALIQHRLTCKALTRYNAKAVSLNVGILELESREKILLTV